MLLKHTCNRVTWMKMSELYTIPRNLQPRLRAFSLRKCDRPFIIPIPFKGKALKKRWFRLPILNRKKGVPLHGGTPKFGICKKNGVWFNFPQAFRKFVPNGKHRNSKLSPCAHVAFTGTHKILECLHEFMRRNVQTMKRSFLGVADFSGDDDHLAKVHRLIDFRSRLKTSIHVNELNFTHLLHGWVGTKLRFEKTTEIQGRLWRTIRMGNHDHSKIRDFWFEKENEFSWRLQ